MGGCCVEIEVSIQSVVTFSVCRVELFSLRFYINISGRPLAPIYLVSPLFASFQPFWAAASPNALDPNKERTELENPFPRSGVSYLWLSRFSVALRARLKGESGCDIGDVSNGVLGRSWRLERQMGDMLSLHLSDFRLYRYLCTSHFVAGVSFSRPRLARSTHDAASKWIPTTDKTDANSGRP